MLDQIDWSSTETARLMGLDYTPRTSTAVGFCEALGNTLAGLETHRKNQRRGDRKKTFNETAGAFVADLLKAAQTAPGRWSYRVLTTASFTDALVSYTDFRSVLRAAEAGQLIEKQPGHYRRFDFGGGAIAGTGRATRFRARPELLTFATSCGLTPENVEEHFERRLPKLPPRPLVLRGSSTRMRHRKFKGRGLKFERTAQTDRLERDLRDLNQFLSLHEIGHGVHRGYHRIFNQGDRHPYRWDKGGRLYSIGEDSYQTLKKVKRLEMTLDGEPVAEIDIRASYLTLLHGLKGVPFDAVERDPYKVGHLPRAVVKAWVTMTIGHTDFHRSWPKRTAEALRENGEDSIDTKKYPVKQIAPVILAALPILKDWPRQPLSGFDLMYRESEAVIGTMLELMREHDVPSLSVHDSIIVPIRRTNEACSILKRRYREVSGIVPHLQTRLPSSLSADF
jgi:hypothetical protein